MCMCVCVYARSPCSCQGAAGLHSTGPARYRLMMMQSNHHFGTKHLLSLAASDGILIHVQVTHNVTHHLWRDVLLLQTVQSNPVTCPDLTFVPNSVTFAVGRPRFLCCCTVS
jgi:hypothetical protein